MNEIKDATVVEADNQQKFVFVESGKILPSRNGKSIKIFDNNGNFMGFTSRRDLLAMLRNATMYSISLYKKQNITFPEDKKR